MGTTTVRLTKDQKIKVANSRQLYKIMKEVLLRDNMFGRSKEHFWVVGFNNASYIINIELVALGSMSRAVITPSDVFSIAFQKRAAYVVLVHNHPSGEVKPSDADLDLTDQMYQIGKYHQCRVYDHLIISEKKYLSMRDKGYMKNLEKHTNYPVNQIEDMARLLRREREIKREKAIEMAKGLLLAGVDPKIIAMTSGLSVEEIKELK